MLLLLSLLGCEDTQSSQLSRVEIPQEAYEWTCYDYPSHTEIEITAGVCNEFDSLTVSVQLLNSEYIEQDMYHEGGCWWYSLIFPDGNCITIEEIFITAEEGGSNGR